MSSGLADAAASVLGANNLLQYNFSIFLSLVGPAMYSSLSYEWGNPLLGSIVLVFVLAPVLFKVRRTAPYEGEYED